MEPELIYGVRPVLEALRSGRREVLEVLMAIRNPEISSLAASRKVPVSEVPRREIERLASGVVHQGVIARTGDYPYSDLDEILDTPSPLVVVLDGVTDPRNLGAVLRAADGTGSSGVVIPKDRAAPVTPAAVKASAGASEHVRVARETNLRRAIERMKRAGIWVYAAESGEHTLYTDIDLSDPVAIVFGGEESGIRRLVREGCDGVFSIPMLGAVDSLNVSAAAAVVLYEAIRQRGWRGT
ncbi:23S rRNA (guanosine(2251)-2'-O)-methyltransferase RlmB [Rubrobacter calidifluminis]|uniref:23S rRNA (guanosine(2251)-2'-O)-methyltransferase RlmB n=1 Tax=Rubrobacter calidifluminis TaxID=1392640 RepID=UPI00235FEB40|nr:23S rRNA (guanosine(2251)-2'-O)-methyltransferase RlmB [Rubrobacter calidifluminis]